ncbi:MAG: peptidoglycan-binding domain-containing protein [Candidatus Paceibacterota bacterium]|jgi:peptidoglycan hydrolase-like protein with peptidoglycan-binding domain
MRILLSSFAVALLVLSYGALASAQSSVQNMFTTNLSLGSRGTQVLLLQQVLNRDPDTRIANSGVGSPGNETSYFGSLTKTAVVLFQQKYAQDVLAPAGLFQGNGYVGAYTRAKLNALSSPTTNSVGASAQPATTSTLPSLPSSPSSASTPAAQNSNSQNLDIFLAAIDKVGTKQGLSASELATIKKQIVTEAATTTDLRAEFMKQVGYAPRRSATNDSFGGQVLAIIEHAFSSVFLPEHARAATGVPFGGAFVYASYCTCSLTWILGITPLPPTFAVLLTYVPFSQAFLSYNIPATKWLLGNYIPGAGACSYVIPSGCTPPIPNEGMITPVVGSSPL